MVSFQQLMACQPQRFTEAGQTYRRMAEGFGRVEGIFRQATRVISGTTQWSGAAQRQALDRANTLGKGLQAGGQETNSAGTALTTLGTALTAAQTALRAAVAEALTGPLIMTPDGQTVIPPWAYSWPACVAELPRLQALKAVVDVQIRAALTAATTADLTAAGAIGTLAVGQLVKDFGGSRAPAATNPTDPNATLGNRQPAVQPASYQVGPPTAPDTRPEVDGLLAATGGAGTDGSVVSQDVTTADWRGMSADGTNPNGVRVAQANADGGRQVGGTIGGAALATTAATRAVAQAPAPQAVQAAVAREVTANGRRYVIFDDEVRSGGSVSWRARNPGNIRNGVRYGAVPGVRVHGGHGTFAVFPDEQTGMAAIGQVLQGYGHVTVAAAMSRYAPAGDRNDPAGYAAAVARAMGVGTDAYVDALNQDQLTTFAQEIRRVEGWREGTTHRLDDPNLPAAVRQVIDQMRPR